MFYTSVFRRSNTIYVRGYNLGLRHTEKVAYTPYLFIPSSDGEYRTIDGNPVRKHIFASIKDARTFVERYQEVDNFNFYGITQFEYAYINDHFPGHIQYDPRLIRIGTFDIECEADEGFPDVDKAEKPITAITIKSRGKTFVFGCGEFVSNDPSIEYVKCEDEYALIAEFLKCWKTMDLDIITGWNIEFFDIPYLINRIKALYTKDVYKRLSPWGFVDEKKAITKYGKEANTYVIHGIAILDYLPLYRKFSFGNQEQYTLDFIGEIELGEKKLDYTQYGNLLELYKKNYQKFIEYNIQDVILVEKLDKKLNFLEQIMALAYDAKVNYIDTLATVRPWDVIIHNYLMERKIVVPKMEENEIEETLMGGHVKEPIPGMYHWVVSFDLNSLYPHLIMQYNISPDTFVFRSKKEKFNTIEQLIAGQHVSRSENLSWTANGCAYRKDKHGFLPEIMQTMYNDRVKYKKMMIEAKKSFEQTKNPADEMLIARYHNMQMAKKIQLNSAYGALGNTYFRWFNFNHAEAITSSGQLTIQFIERKINEYMNKLLGTDSVDYIIAADTDSIYITMGELVKQSGLTDPLKIVNAIDKFCESKIQAYINKSFQELADNMNAYEQKMYMKRETIANKGLWRKKKNYALNAWNVEGVQYDKPKLKIQGLEAVRSSTPRVCREAIKKAISIIMNGTEIELQKFILEFKNEFKKLPYNAIASPRSVNGLDKYSDADNVYGFKTPFHVKGALLFNNMLKKHNIKTIPPIRNGDKIKFAYLLLPNPVHDTVIATTDYIPPEFNLDKYIDKDTQFNKSFLEPIKSLTDLVDWRTEKRIEITDFF